MQDELAARRAARERKQRSTQSDDELVLSVDVYGDHDATGGNDYTVQYAYATSVDEVRRLQATIESVACSVSSDIYDGAVADELPDAWKAEPVLSHFWTRGGSSIVIAMAFYTDESNGTLRQRLGCFWFMMRRGIADLRIMMQYGWRILRRLPPP
jgi:hypothetical protein